MNKNQQFWILDYNAIYATVLRTLSHGHEQRP